MQTEYLKASQKPYSQQKLTFTNDSLRDEDGNAVMMQWEEGIMKKQANTVCKNGGAILNIGFGMGYIDTYIQEYNSKLHVIIECHPDVWEKMKVDGWLDKPNVQCVFGKWQNIIPQFLNSNIKFDGIYYDTWGEMNFPFYEITYKLLNPNGIFTFFNKSGDVKLKINPLTKSILSQHLNITCESFNIPTVPHQHEDGRDYWDVNNLMYHNPICTLKK